MIPKMKQQQRTRRCHWVPQSYLRAFACDHPDRKKIWRFGKSDNSGPAEIKLIKKVAVKHHLYAPIDCISKRRNDSFEQELGDVERWFGEPIWKKLCEDYADLSWLPLRKLVALTVAIMQFRNPIHLLIYKNVHHEFVQFLAAQNELPTSLSIGGISYPLHQDSWSEFRNETDEDCKRHWIDEIRRVGWYATLLLKMRWSIIHTDEPLFVTSDNPVTIIHPSLKFRGINDPNSSLMFPISPTRLLIMDHLHNEPHDKYYPLRGDGSVQNGLLFRHAGEWMFSHRPPEEVCSAIVADAERRGFA